MKTASVNRRHFLCTMTHLSGAVACATVLPVSALTNSTGAQWTGHSPGRYTYMDEALGNYPAYAEEIGFGRGHLLAGNAQAQPEITDGQFMA